MQCHQRLDKTMGRCIYGGVHCINCTHTDDLPSIVAAFGIIAIVIEQTAEVHEDGSRGIWGYKVSLHFLGRRKWRYGNGSILQADMVLLSKGLNQRSTLKQGEDSPGNCFLFLKQ